MSNQTVKIDMVVGLMFDSDLQHVLMLLKLKGPPVVRNRWNGIGGKIEDGETAVQAMVREFEEECGAKTLPEDWTPILLLTGSWGSVMFYRAIDEVEHLVSVGLKTSVDSPTKELVHWRAARLLPSNVVPNLKWIIPLALDIYPLRDPAPIHLPILVQEL